MLVQHGGEDHLFSWRWTELAVFRIPLGWKSFVFHSALDQAGSLSTPAPSQASRLRARGDGGPRAAAGRAASNGSAVPSAGATMAAGGSHNGRNNGARNAQRDRDGSDGALDSMRTVPMGAAK